MGENITFHEVVVAYRKVKNFIYRRSGRPRILKILEFEQKLTDNLQAVYKRISQNEVESFVSDCEGSYLVTPTFYVRDDMQPKSISIDANRFINAPDSDEERDWAVGDNCIQTRSNLGIQSEIVFALWVMKYGAMVDALMGSHVWGDRLKCDGEGHFMLESPLLYRDFYEDLSDWQTRVCKEIRNLMEADRDVVAFVGDLLDITRYISFDNGCDRGTRWAFLRKLEELGVPIDNYLTTLVEKMLRSWIDSTPATLGHGLPVGSVLSGLIQNLFLHDLDDLICEKIRPLWYARCGRRLAIIMDGKIAGKKDKEETPKWYVDLIKGAIQDFLPTDSIDKVQSRLFLFRHKDGFGYIDALESALKADSQFWEKLPEIGDVMGDTKEMYSPFGDMRRAKNIVSAGPLELSKRHFAKTLKSMECFLLDLGLDDWKSQRIAFLKTVVSSFSDLRSWLRYYTLYPRILSIAFGACNNRQSEEFSYAVNIIEKFLNQVELFSDVVRKSKQLKGMWYGKLMDDLRKPFLACVIEHLCLTVKDDTTKDDLIDALSEKFPIPLEYKRNPLLKKETLRYSDLLCQSFKDYILQSSWDGIWMSPNQLPDNAKCNISLLQDSNMRRGTQSGSQCMGMQAFLNFFRGKRSVDTDFCDEIPTALYFSTRSWDITDLYALYDGDVKDMPCGSNLKNILSEFGWNACSVSMPDFLKTGEFVVTTDKLQDKVRIGLVSWRVHNDSWISMVTKSKDPFRLDRHTRWMRLVNDILKLESEKKPHYVLFPELAVPPAIFMRTARRLAKNGISLIAGIDYLHKSKKEKDATRNSENTIKKYIKNQVWCSLAYDGYEDSPVILKYSKRMLANKEERQLHDIANADLVEASDGDRLVVRHGNATNNLCFSVLICNELLDISARARLRGKIDILFVPAWNRDIPTYAAAIEASAYDIHSYVALCNSREYGDTRLRVPAKESYSRDIVQLRGGVSDYFAIGEIEIYKLREFQSNHLSPEELFKPVPPGFEISELRKSLPRTGYGVS